MVVIFNFCDLRRQYLNWKAWIMVLAWGQSQHNDLPTWKIKYVGSITKDDIHSFKSACVSPQNFCVHRVRAQRKLLTFPLLEIKSICWIDHTLDPWIQPLQIYILTVCLTNSHWNDVNSPTHIKLLFRNNFNVCSVSI